MDRIADYIQFVTQSIILYINFVAEHPLEGLAFLTVVCTAGCLTEIVLTRIFTCTCHKTPAK